jgi:hypothetical protein
LSTFLLQHIKPRMEPLKDEAGVVVQVIKFIEHRRWYIHVRGQAFLLAGQHGDGRFKFRSVIVSILAINGTQRPVPPLDTIVVVNAAQLPILKA